jgi:hypothetical protein
MHNKAYAKVVGSPLSFFTANPLGRILNKFSRSLPVLHYHFLFFFSPPFLSGPALDVVTHVLVVLVPFLSDLGQIDQDLPAILYVVNSVKHCTPLL